MKLSPRQFRLLHLLDQLHAAGLRWSFRPSACGDTFHVDLDFPDAEMFAGWRYYKRRMILWEAICLQHDLDIEAEANDIDNPVYPEHLAEEGWG